jgi:hypothetical protein
MRPVVTDRAFETRSPASFEKSTGLGWDMMPLTGIAQQQLRRMEKDDVDPIKKRDEPDSEGIGIP